MNEELAYSYRHCRQVARSANSNFSWVFRLLPADQRRGMEALYAFARHLDDVTDSEELLERKQLGLDFWREELAAGLDGKLHGPVMPALADTVQRFQIPRKHLEQILDGVAMDLDHHGFETFDELRRYAEHVASAVGLACLAIWGCRDARACAAATDCGIAFQLTNILRDLSEDARLGRCYVPLEDLQRFGLSQDRFPPPLPLASEDRQEILELLKFEIERTKGFYDSASTTADYLAGRPKKMFRLMHATYRGLLAKIEREPLAVLQRRIRLSRPHKAWLAARVLLT
jgi:phytoene synthase